MLGKNQHGAQLLRYFPHEALQRGEKITGVELDLELCVCFIRLRKQTLGERETYGVVAEPGDVTFIAGVE